MWCGWMEVLFLPSSTLMQRGSALVEERKQAVREEQREGYGGPVRGQRVHAPWAHRPLRPADEKRLRALEHPGPTGPYPQGGPGTLLGRPPLVGRGRKKKMRSGHPFPSLVAPFLSLSLTHFLVACLLCFPFLLLCQCRLFFLTHAPSSSFLRILLLLSS